VRNPHGGSQTSSICSFQLIEENDYNTPAGEWNLPAAGENPCAPLSSMPSMHQNTYQSARDYIRNGEADLRIDQDLDRVNRVVISAKHRLINEPHLSVQRIWCEYDGQRLILRGQVPSFYHKQLAQVAVANMEDVSQVVNEIEVLW
jgi:hypothetical protein